MAETFSPILAPDTEARIDAIMRRLSEDNVRLATAESCTGGILASLFTDIPGCSHVFEAGFVTYSDAAKRQMLGIAMPIWPSPSPALPVQAAIARKRAWSISPAPGAKASRCMLNATLAPGTAQIRGYAASTPRSNSCPQRWDGRNHEPRHRVDPGDCLCAGVLK